MLLFVYCICACTIIVSCIKKNKYLNKLGIVFKNKILIKNLLILMPILILKNSSILSILNFDSD